MAALTVQGFEEVLKKLDKLSNKGKVDEITKKAVNAAKGELVSAMKSAIAASERTGAIAASVDATDALVNSYGTYAVSKPNGRHPSTIRNAKLAAMLEYGGHNLPARPWRAAATAASESTCIKIMEDVLKDEMELD